MSLDLSPLFDPKGIVITGVSNHPGKFGFVALHNVLRCGFEGPVFPVGREAGVVLDIDVLGSVDDVPDGAADLVFICTPPALNEGILRGCAARGVRAAFVAAGGYREAGDAEAEDRLIALAAELGMVLAGPNGQGVVSPPASLCAQIVAPYPPRGNIGVASQSGNFVSTFLNYANQTGVGISRAISAGNASATGIADYLDWYTDDPETNVSLVYVEGLTDGRGFAERIRALTPRKPVVILKGGATASGQRAAASHTGALATDDAVFDGVARQVGLVRAPDVEAAFETAASFATQPLPRGPRVVILTTVGGWGVVAADAVSTTSLELTPLPDDLLASIDERLPPRWSRNNPIDLAGGETRDTIPEVMELVAGHPEVDAVVCLGFGIQSNQAALTRSGPYYPDHGLERIVDFHERQDRRYAEAAAAASDRTGKPVMVATELAVADPGNSLVEAVRASGRLCYPSAHRAITALDRMYQYHQWRERRA